MAVATPTTFPAEATTDPAGNFAVLCREIRKRAILLCLSWGQSWAHNRRLAVCRKWSEMHHVVQELVPGMKSWKLLKHIKENPTSNDQHRQKRQVRGKLCSFNVNEINYFISADSFTYAHKQESFNVYSNTLEKRHCFVLQNVAMAAVSTQTEAVNTQQTLILPLPVAIAAAGSLKARQSVRRCQWSTACVCFIPALWWFDSLPSSTHAKLYIAF